MMTEEKTYFNKGRVITGRWEGSSYLLVRPLGEGGTAAVFLVRTQEGILRAMKISPHLDLITHEYRVLLYLNNCSEIKNLQAVPRVYELDDFYIDNKVFHYIITDFCPGTNLARFIGRLDSGKAVSLGSQIARFLEILHLHGLVYGDLKPGNIICDFRKNQVFITDYGSVTRLGRPLNQYTPSYDRANWHAGPRIADECYDIFSLGMLLVFLTTGKIKGVRGGLNQVIKRVLNRTDSKELQNIIIKALHQDLTECRHITDNLLSLKKESVKPKTLQQSGKIVNYLGAISVFSAIAVALIYY